MFAITCKHERKSGTVVTVYYKYMDGAGHPMFGTKRDAAKFDETLADKVIEQLRAFKNTTYEKVEIQV